jgi:hypothetical protein
MNPFLPEDKLAKQARAFAESYAARIVAQQRAQEDRVLCGLVLCVVAPLILTGAVMWFLDGDYGFGTLAAVIGAALIVTGSAGITGGDQ